MPMKEVDGATGDGVSSLYVLCRCPMLVPVGRWSVWEWGSEDRGRDLLVAEEPAEKREEISEK